MLSHIPRGGGQTHHPQVQYGTRGFAPPDEIRTAVCVLRERSSPLEVRCHRGGCLARKRLQSITRPPFSGKSTSRTREHIMMSWSFQTGRSCSSLTCSKVRKQQCSSFRHNPLPHLRRRASNRCARRLVRKLQHHCLGPQVASNPASNLTRIAKFG